MKIIIKYILINRIFIILMTLSCAFFLLPQLKNPIQKGNGDFDIFQNDHIYTFKEDKNILKNMWTVWDSKWYISIADEGYSTQKQPYKKIDNKGFMPLYPLLLSIISNFLLFGDTVLAGIIISNFFLILSLFILKKFVESDEKLKDKLKINDAYLYLLFFPTSYYLSCVYPESLFLFLSIFSLYLINKNKILWSSLIISLTIITKIYGLFLLIPFAFFIYKNKSKISIKKISLSLLLISSIPLLYMLYMYYTVNDLFAYMHIQDLFFGHYWSNPIETILLDVYFRLNTQSFINGIATIIGLIILFLGRKLIKIEHILYSLAYIIFTPITGMTSSNFRYMSGLIFIPIILSLYIEKEDNKLLIIYIMSFIQGFTILWWFIGSTFMA